MFTVHHLPPPLPAHGPDLCAQEIPLNLQLPNLLVEPGDESFLVLADLVLVSAEDIGRSSQQRLLPRLNLAGMDLVPGGQLGHRQFPFHRLQGHLGLE